MPRDVHPSSFPEDMKRLEREALQAERAAALNERQSLPVTIHLRVLRGYCANPRCKSCPHDDTEREVAA
jgi:hypothetical protein